MLAPLDTEETLAARPTIEANLYTVLTRAFPRMGIVALTVTRDPSTLAEVVSVTIRQRVVTESPVSMADMLTGHLRSNVRGWDALEAAGLSLKVTVEAPPLLPGAEADDEVSLRSLPGPNRTSGTTSAIGKRVAFRAPLWRVLFQTIASAPGDNALAEQLAPHAPELGRIRTKALKLLAGQDPEALRIGTLVQYDPVTDHALVEVKLNHGKVFVHTAIAWTMEWNVPDAPPAPSPARR